MQLKYSGNKKRMMTLKLDTGAICKVSVKQFPVRDKKKQGC